MSELPFPLREYHKREMKALWKHRGIIFVDDEHFEYIYNEYIHATNCDLCNKQFLKSTDRQLDHDHTRLRPEAGTRRSCRAALFAAWWRSRTSIAP